MNDVNYKGAKLACYFTNLAMSAIFAFPPIVFTAFREIYGISYTLLGTLVVINFLTQLTVDLIFSFFSKYFNIHKIIRIMPLLTAFGLCVYGIIPTLFPNFAYIGLSIGTVIFSVSAGLDEVLISPTIAAIPSDNPDRDMSKLHSLYAYGFVGVVIISTLYIKILGYKNWMYLAFFWALLPVFASIFLHRVQLPNMNKEQNLVKTKNSKKRRIGIFLCMSCIFLGSAAENTMTNWVSVYTENALSLPKIWGDIIGMCMFATLLGLARSAYAKYGKNIYRVLLLSMLGAAGCYIVVGFSKNSYLSIIACALTGLFTSMLWPGTLILMEEKIPSVGVVAYALMAAGGDCGASIAPQMVGAIIDKVSESDWVRTISLSSNLTGEQIGMKIGMLIAALFPILGTVLLIYMKSFFKKSNER